MSGGISAGTIMAAVATSAAGALGSQLMGSLFGGGSGGKGASAPAANVIAPPAPTSRNNTGASVALGSDSSNTRVSGRGRATLAAAQGDVLGGLGSSGLNI